MHCFWLKFLNSSYNSSIFYFKSAAISLLAILSSFSWFLQQCRSALRFLMNLNIFLLYGKVSASFYRSKYVLPQSAKLASNFSSSSQRFTTTGWLQEKSISLCSMVGYLCVMLEKSQSVLRVNSCQSEVLSKDIYFWYCSYEISSIFPNLFLIWAQLAISCCRYVISSVSSWFCRLSSLFCSSCKAMVCLSQPIYLPSSLRIFLSFYSVYLVLSVSHSKENCLSVMAFTVSPCCFTFSANFSFFILYCSNFLPIFSMMVWECANRSSFSTAITVTVSFSAFSQSRCAFLSLQSSSSSRRTVCSSRSLSWRSLQWHCIIYMSREWVQAVQLAKIAQQTERYDDMVKHVREVVRGSRAEKTTLQEQEVKLLSTAYKCKVNARRTAWRALEILHSKQANSKNRSAAIIQFYKDNIEKEIREISQEAISTADSVLKMERLKLPVRLDLYKMRGDFHRYLCEISKDPDELKKLQKECQSTYRKGIEQLKAQQKRGKEGKQGESVPTYDSRRLALYLNLSVFYFEIMAQLPKAIETCEQGFNSALQNISDLEQAKYIDSVTIMQLMHDNITAWRSEKDKK